MIITIGMGLIALFSAANHALETHFIPMRDLINEEDGKVGLFGAMSLIDDSKHQHAHELDVLLREDEMMRWGSMDKAERLRVLRIGQRRGELLRGN